MGVGLGSRPRQVPQVLLTRGLGRLEQGRERLDATTSGRAPRCSRRMWGADILPP